MLAGVSMSARAALLALLATALSPAGAMRTPCLVAARARSSDAILVTGTKAAHDAARKVASALDKDGDGKVSVQEMEQALGIFGRVYRRLRRVWRSNRNVCLVLAGLFGLTNARRFPYSILVLQTFQATGWPLVRNGLERAGEAYGSAKAAAAYDVASRREAVDELRAELRALAEVREALPLPPRASALPPTPLILPLRSTRTCRGAAGATPGGRVLHSAWWRCGRHCPRYSSSPSPGPSPNSSPKRTRCARGSTHCRQLIVRALFSQR